MRFLEFQNSNKELESALMNTLNQLRGEADEKDQSSQISLDAVTSIMKNTALKQVVKDFDREKIVIKTEKDAEDDPQMDFDNQGSTDKVKQMAKSAMNRRK